MKLEHLLETNDPDLFAAKRTLYNDCKRIVDQYQRSGWKRIIWRGMKPAPASNHDGWFKLMITRQSRDPRDSGKEEHGMWDAYLEDRFGVKGRSRTVFGTLDIENAERYGPPHAIFPVGNFRIIYSPKLSDMWETDSQLVSDAMHEFWYERYEKAFQMLDKYDYEEVNDVNNIRSVNAELMVDCDMYYAVPYERAKFLFKRDR